MRTVSALNRQARGYSAWPERFAALNHADVVELVDTPV